MRGRWGAAAAGAVVCAVVAGCSGPPPVASPAVTVSSPAPTAAPTHATTSPNPWELVWDDEFDGTAIDPSKWSFETDCWGGGNDELQCYTDRAANAFVRDGALVVRAQREDFTGPAEPVDWPGTDPSVTADRHYTSARLRTLDKGDWTYGRIEVRATLPGGQGVWPAIWMLPSRDTYGQWPVNGEIDIMEAINLGGDAPASVYGSLHRGGKHRRLVSDSAEYVFSGASPREGFHTYALEWSDAEIRWYVDGTKYASVPATDWLVAGVGPGGDTRVLRDGPPFDQPFHLLLNVAVGGTWPGSPDAATPFPADMVVDYVRVYACPASPATLAECAGAPASD